MNSRILSLALLLTCWSAHAAEVKYYKVPEGAHPHDVAADPKANGAVWYTAQHQGALGRLDPRTGKALQISLGEGSRPHGVIIGPDRAAWVTDGGLNAIVRVDPATLTIKRYPLPISENANLNTATFDKAGRLWFTGQVGYHGRVDPKTGKVDVWKSPRGRGPYGITTTPSGDVYYASLAGNHIARIDLSSGKATPIEPPTPKQGARRVWSDSRGRIWVSEWLSGQVSVFDPKATKDQAWRSWKLPGNKPQTYSVWVDENDNVWLTDFAANAIVRFDPDSGHFESFPSDSPNAAVRQMLGRKGEAWGAESGTDRLVVVKHGK
ncbi:MAG TPA: lyase [Lysobacter sp.]|nr:lyase [Lysobacter sp.]